MRRRNAPAAGVSKLPMFDPRKSTSTGLPASRADAARRKPFLVGRLMADDGDVLPAREPALGLFERLRRDVDQMDAR